MGFPGGSLVKNLPANSGDLGMICLTIQETWVWSLSGKTPPAVAQPGPGAATSGPASTLRPGTRAASLSPWAPASKSHPRVRAPREAGPSQLENSPHSPQQEKGPSSSEDAAQTQMHKQIFKSNKQKVLLKQNALTDRSLTFTLVSAVFF